MDKDAGTHFILKKKTSIIAMFPKVCLDEFGVKELAIWDQI